jgi:hypothetical protein
MLFFKLSIREVFSIVSRRFCSILEEKSVCVSESEGCPTSCAGNSSLIQDDIVYFVIQPEWKGSRTSLAGGIYTIPDDTRVCFGALKTLLGFPPYPVRGRW